LVQIDLLNPIFDDLLTLGRPKAPPRPWLGLYAHRNREPSRGGSGLPKDGPSQKADLRTGDVLLSIAGRPRSADLARPLSQGMVARCGAALRSRCRIYRDGKTIETRVKSGDRARFLKAPKLH